MRPAEASGTGCGRGGAVFLLVFGWSRVSIAKKVFFWLLNHPFLGPLARGNRSFYLKLFVCFCKQLSKASFFSTLWRCRGSNKETTEIHCHLLARTRTYLKRALDVGVGNEESDFHHNKTAVMSHRGGDG